MSFMLGSFTSGLMQGFSSTIGAMKGLQELKGMYAASDAADATKNAMDADASKKLGTAAAPQATPQATTGGMDRHDVTGEGNTPAATGKSDLGHIDLNSVPKPNYMTGVQPSAPSPREHDNTTVGPAAAPQAPMAPGVSPGENPGPTVKPGAPAPATGNQTATGVGGKPAESAASTFGRWWDKFSHATSSNTAQVDPTTGAPTAVADTSHPGAIGMPENAATAAASQPAGAGGAPAQGVPTHPMPTPTAQAQTGWHALLHPSAGQPAYLPQQAVPTGNTMPAQAPRPTQAVGNPAPLQMNLASQNTPTAQSMLAGIPGL